jgi:hypothetical protein
MAGVARKVRYCGHAGGARPAAVATDAERETHMSSTTTPPSTADAGNRIQPPQKRAALTVAMLGFAVVALDAQITNVALPAIRQHLGGGLSGLQWVVTGYTLMFSALLLFGGSVADRVGSKNAYRYGMALFVLASLLCGLAPTLPVLVAARAGPRTRRPTGRNRNRSPAGRPWRRKTTARRYGPAPLSRRTRSGTPAPPRSPRPRTARSQPARPGAGASPRSCGHPCRTAPPGCD